MHLLQAGVEVATIALWLRQDRLETTDHYVEGTVCRSKVERILLGALRDRLLQPDALRHALGRVADEIARLAGQVTEVRARKQAELAKAGKMVTAALSERPLPRPRLASLSFVWRSRRLAATMILASVFRRTSG